VVAELEARGHDGVAIELPFDDDDAALPEYVDAVIDQVGERRELVMVGQSLGAFSASQACDRLPVELLVLLAPMIPAPGETPGEWWTNTGHAEAYAPLGERLGPMEDWGDEELNYAFLHDVAPELQAQVGDHTGAQSSGIFREPLSLDAWPDVPTKVLICTEDRFFPPDFQRRVTRERLGFAPDEMSAGHVAMLARPAELAERLVAYYEEVGEDR
jgi:hypothetical protein